jgi:hypothetical protein
VEGFRKEFIIDCCFVAFEGALKGHIESIDIRSIFKKVRWKIAVKSLSMQTQLQHNREVLTYSPPN